MWVVTFHSLFLYSDLPLPCHPPSYWLRLFLSQTFSRINTPTFLKPSHTFYLPAYEDGTDSVPKHQHIKFRRRQITQKKVFNNLRLFSLHILGFECKKHSISDIVFRNITVSNKKKHSNLVLGAVLAITE